MITRPLISKEKTIGQYSSFKLCLKRYLISTIISMNVIRELRKRKTISQDTSVNLMEGKRRKGAYPLQSDDDEEKDDVSDSLFVPGDDEYVSSSGENEMKTLVSSGYIFLNRLVERKALVEMI